MIIQKNTTFFNTASEPAISKAVFNVASDTLSLQVDGDFTNGTFYIEGRNSTEGEWYPIAAVDLTHLTVYRNGLTQPGLYEFAIVSVREIRARIAEIEGGTVSISGQLIATEET